MSYPSATPALERDARRAFAERDETLLKETLKHAPQLALMRVEYEYKSNFLGRKGAWCDKTLLEGCVDTGWGKGVVACCKLGKVQGSEALEHALRAATAKAHATMVRALLKAGADPNGVDGRPPLADAPLGSYVINDADVQKTFRLLGEYMKVGFDPWAETKTLGKSHTLVEDLLFNEKLPLAMGVVVYAQKEPTHPLPETLLNDSSQFWTGFINQVASRIRMSQGCYWPDTSLFFAGLGRSLVEMGMPAPPVENVQHLILEMELVRSVFNDEHKPGVAQMQYTGFARLLEGWATVLPRDHGLVQWSFETLEPVMETLPGPMQSFWQGLMLTRDTPQPVARGKAARL